ncbi:hypothetical protein IAU59_007053 [Kwoniella sp. CBS 9459]
MSRQSEYGNASRRDHDLARDIIPRVSQIPLGQPLKHPQPGNSNGNGNGSGNGYGRDHIVEENRKRLTQRDSTLESAGDAADIFDLYGAGAESEAGAGADPRDSWQSTGSYQAQNRGDQRESRIGVAHGNPEERLRDSDDTSRANGHGHPDRYNAGNGAGAFPISRRKDENGMTEELASPKESEASWAGVSGFMGSENGNGGTSTPNRARNSTDNGYAEGPDSDHRQMIDRGEDLNGVQAASRWSQRSGSAAPDISITDTTPSPTATTTPIPLVETLSTPTTGRTNNNGAASPNIAASAGDSPSKKAPFNYDPRKASLASSISSTASFNQHQQQQRNSLSANRLSPRHPSTLTRGRGSTSTMSYTDRSSTGTGEGRTAGEASMSQTSVAGSAQYPGEEDDAFYIRSTYARLDSEGVHGDGWDPGVERTRGGPGSSKRATVYPASKAGDIGEQERQYLASLDRYGFVNEPHRNRNETRIALIPTSPLQKIPKLPSVSPLAGKPPAEPNNAFMPSSDSGPSAKTPPSPRLNGSEEAKLKAKETERVDKWGKMMSIKRRDHGGNICEWDWRKDAQGAKLPRRVYKGIPDRWRMAAWWTLAEDTTRDYRGKGKGKKPANEILDDYKNTIDLPSSFDVQIDLDVPRTISGHTMFVTRYGAGQRNLWHVLHAFSQVCETCGYVQGMGPIAATLLCYFDPERAYALLVRLHDIYGMHDIFEPGFPGLLEAFYVQERLMEWLMPDVYQSFQRNMISSSAWGTKWYITLFVNTVPFSQQLRIWDALWLDGRDVMVVTSLAILWAFKDLLSSPQATFESILSLLSSYFVAEDEDALMRWIRKVLKQKPVRDKMDSWRSEWAGLVKQGKSGQALL